MISGIFFIKTRLLSRRLDLFYTPFTSSLWFKDPHNIATRDSAHKKLIEPLPITCNKEELWWSLVPSSPKTIGNEGSGTHVSALL